MNIFLHVGCGSNTKKQTTPGFSTVDWEEVRLDIDERVIPDIVGSMTDLSSIESNKFDAIFSSHNIEHLYPHQVGTTLKEFRRVLRPSGFIVITCPDLIATAKLVADDKLTDTAYISPVGAITPLDILYGHIKSLENGDYYMAHKTGFSEKSLRNELRLAGFSRSATCSRPSNLDIWALATKEIVSNEDLLSLFKEFCGV